MKKPCDRPTSPQKGGQLPPCVPTTTVNYHSSAPTAATTRKSTQKQQQQSLFLSLCSGNLIIEIFSHVAGHCLRINFKIYYTGFPGSVLSFFLVVEFLRPSNQSDQDTLRLAKGAVFWFVCEREKRKTSCCEFGWRAIL